MNLGKKIGIAGTAIALAGAVLYNLPSRYNNVNLSNGKFASVALYDHRTEVKFNDYRIIDNNGNGFADMKLKIMFAKGIGYLPSIESVSADDQNIFREAVTKSELENKK